YLRAGERDDEYAAKFTEKTPLNTAPYALFFPNNFNAVARIDPVKGLNDRARFRCSRGGEFPTCPGSAGKLETRPHSRFLHGHIDWVMQDVTIDPGRTFTVRLPGLGGT